MITAISRPQCRVAYPRECAHVDMLRSFVIDIPSLAWFEKFRTTSISRQSNATGLNIASPDEHAAVEIAGCIQYVMEETRSRGMVFFRLGIGSGTRFKCELSSHTHAPPRDVESSPPGNLDLCTYKDLWQHPICHHLICQFLFWYNMVLLRCNARTPAVFAWSEVLANCAVISTSRSQR